MQTAAAVPHRFRTLNLPSHIKCPALGTPRAGGSCDWREAGWLGKTQEGVLGVERQQLVGKVPDGTSQLLKVTPRVQSSCQRLGQRNFKLQMFGMGQRELGGRRRLSAPDCPCPIPLCKDILWREKSQSCSCLYKTHA